MGAVTRCYSWSPEGHSPRSDPRIQDWPGDKPCGLYASTAIARAPHAPQDFPDCALTPIEARQLGNGERPLSLTAPSQAVHREIEASEFMQRTGQDGGTLSAGGGVGGGHLILPASVKAPHECKARQRKLLGQMLGADPSEENFRAARHLPARG